VMAVVDGATWGKVQIGDFGDKVQSGMRKALQTLYDNPDVCAIVGHAGFFSLYQSHASDIVDDIVEASNGVVVRKPMILGTPTMLSALTRDASLNIPNWGMMQEDSDVVLVITSNFPSLTRPAIETVLQAYVDGYKDVDGDKQGWVTTNAASVYSMGWNEMPGYSVSVVYGALFHNAYLTAANFKPQLQGALANISALKQRVVAIIMESTEMAPNANDVRLAAGGIPVWDISTLAKCLMAASFSYTSSNSNIAEELLKMPEFKDCMMVWVKDPTKLETRFGTQADGRLKHYQDQNLTVEQLEKLQCGGGRVKGMRHPIGRLMTEFDTGSAAYSEVREGCLMTEKYCRCDGCDGPCPGGGSCGWPTAPCGVTGESSGSQACKDEVKIDAASFLKTEQCPATTETSNIPAA